MQFANPFRSKLLAALSCVALVGGAYTLSADAQNAPPKRVIFGVVPPADGESNNPNRDIAANDEYQLKPMYENLIGVDPETSEWVPMLAESWEMNEAGDRLTFNIRKGVQFHNDFGEMTAEDVVFSLVDSMEPAGAMSDTGRILRTVVSEMEIADPYTLVFHVKPGLGLPFFEGISYGAAGAVVKSKKDWESRGGGSPATPKLDEKPIAGTGPYQFVSRTPGQNVVFEKVPYDHWRKNAGFQELEFRYILEDATRLSALLAGEIHMTALPDELGEEAANRGMKIIKSALPGRRYGLALAGCYYKQEWKPATRAAEVFTSEERLYPDSPWCNKDLRIAANKAIDRQALNDAFFGGEGEIARMWYWLPEQTDSWNPEWDSRFDEHLGYDPEGARKILEAQDQPVKIQVIAKNDVAEAVSTMLADAGFEVDLVSMDGGQFNSSREAREFSAMVEFDDTASENITGFEPAGYGNQDSKRAIENVEWDTMYEDVQRELDAERRATLWREFGDIVFENALHVPLLRVYSEVVVNPEAVCGYTFPGANMSDPYPFVEYIDPC
jgi:ABC-type transport system substrate-binding protein